MTYTAMFKDEPFLRACRNYRQLIETFWSSRPAHSGQGTTNIGCCFKSRQRRYGWVVA